MHESKRETYCENPKDFVAIFAHTWIKTRQVSVKIKSDALQSSRMHELKFVLAITIPPNTVAIFAHAWIKIKEAPPPETPGLLQSSRIHELKSLWFWPYRRHLRCSPRACMNQNRRKPPDHQKAIGCNSRACMNWNRHNATIKCIEQLLQSSRMHKLK